MKPNADDDGKYIIKLIVYRIPPEDRGFSLRPVYNSGTYIVWKLGPYKVELWRTIKKEDQPK